MKISVVIPAYKEAENLQNLLPKLLIVLKRMPVNSEVLIIDTMEALDNTEEICLHYGVACIRRKDGNLYGDAIRTGISSAKGNYIIVMDADGSHDPACIEDFYREMQTGKFDMVIGSRYVKEGETENPWILQLMSHTVNIVYRVLFGLKVKDVSNSFRLYRSEQLKSVRLQCSNFDIVEEILITLYVYYPELRVKEVPIRFLKRDKGQSKRNLWAFIASYVITIIRLFRIRHDARIARKGGHI